MSEAPIDPRQFLHLDAEKELIARAQSGDARALSALYQAYVQAVYRYFLIRVGEPTQAEDLTADVFLRVVDGLPRYRERGLPFGAWVFRIAHDKLIDHYRRAARRPVASLTESIRSRSPSPADSAEAGETWQALQSALTNLTDEQRNVIQFRFIEEWSLEETARAMNKSINAIKALQHRALNTLRRRINDDSDSSERST